MKKTRPDGVDIEWVQNSRNAEEKKEDEKLHASKSKDKKEDAEKCNLKEKSKKEKKGKVRITELGTESLLDYK